MKAQISIANILQDLVITTSHQAWERFLEIGWALVEIGSNIQASAMVQTSNGFANCERSSSWNSLGIL